MLAALQAHGLAGAADLAASKPSSSNPADEPSSVGRRRSQRLSAKKAGTSGQTSNDAEGSTSADASAQEAPTSEGNQGNDTSSMTAPQAEPLHGDMLDSDFQADFSEDDVDAELFDEEGDNNGAEKTVNLSVAEGKDKHCIS